MTYVGEFILLLINVVMAAHHAALIKMDRKISHGLWAALYFIVALLFAWMNHNIWLLVVSLPLRKASFDISLNLFRKKSIWYSSASSTSVIDNLLEEINPRIVFMVSVILVIII